MTIEFHHGALADSYEKQANKQGFTYGRKAEWVQNVGFGLVCAHIHGCITDSEYHKILWRFQQKILTNPKFLKRLESEECTCRETENDWLSDKIIKMERFLESDKE